MVEEYLCDWVVAEGVNGLRVEFLTRHKSESSFNRYAKRALAAAAERAFYEAIGEEIPEEMSESRVR